MTTASDLVAEAKHLLLASSRESYATLTSTVTSSVTSIPISNDPGITFGSVIEIDAELIYIFVIAGTSATSVVRGWNGTTPAAHTAGALITVDPRWPVHRLYKAISDEIVSYSSPSHGLYAMEWLTLSVTSSPSAAAYDLAGVVEPLIDIYDVRINVPGLTADWPRVPSWELSRESALPSGYALRVYSSMMPGRPVRVQYKRGFTALPFPINLAYDVALTELPSEATDIPPLGAAARLLAAREARRSSLDVQPEPRQAAEVPPGTARQAAGGFLALRNQRLAEERVRLAARYPDHASRVS